MFPWQKAVVTGSTSGIGHAIAQRLGTAGVEVVHVARELGVDLANRTDLAQVEESCRDIDLLVNNAGLGPEGAFWETGVDDLQTPVDVNVTATMRLTRAALPGMVARGRGAVLIVSSMAGNQPTPGSAVYGATKALLTSLGQALHEELRGTGVTVTTVCPGYTHTEFHERNQWNVSSVPGRAWLTADYVADAALRDAAHGKALSTPGAGYKLLSVVGRLAPRSVNRRALGLAYRRLR